MNLQTDIGVILRTTIYSDYDSIIQIFTKENGTISLMAKGIRKSASKNKGACRVGSIVECEFFSPRNENSMGKLKKLTTIVCHLSDDIYEQTLLQLLSEISAASLPSNYINAEVFSLWENILSHKENTQVHAQIFLCRLFTILGVFPDFNCSIQQSSYFWNESDGISEQALGNIQYKKISLELYKVFKFFSQGDFSLADKIILSPSQSFEFWELFWWFYSHHYDYLPKSKKVWEQLL